MENGKKLEFPEGEEWVRGNQGFPLKKMTTTMKFMDNMKYFSARIDRNTYLYVRPVDKETAVLYFEDSVRNVVPIPKSIEIYDFESAAYSKIDRSKQCVNLILKNSYVIRYDGGIVMSGFRDEPLSHRFEFPLDKEAQIAHDMKNRTVLVNATLKSDSTIVRVSSSKHIHEGMCLILDNEVNEDDEEDREFEREIRIMNVDKETDEITLDEPPLISGTNICVRVR